jgi:hypothetical protein
VASNGAAVDTMPDAYFLPWIRTTGADGGLVSEATLCTNALAAATAHGESFLSLTAFDLTKLEPLTRTLVASAAGYVYASPTALYVAVDRMPETTSYSNGYYGRPLDTVVHKFALEGTATTYRGSVPLPGHILNQFAMDEYLGVLRVASTNGWVPDANVSSSLTTFSETSGRLAQLGQIGGIAPTEDIRSVRFDGDRGFVVTFKKTDPLFVFDLSEPAQPMMLGELLIPGFSTYMHPLDRNHLLALGFNADDQGSYAFFNGIQIQIFDVTVLSNPTVLHKLFIGTRGSSSEALTNHLAFNYFAPKKMLAIPLTICEGGGNGTYGDTLTFSGLMAFDVSLETGIAEHGRMPFASPSGTPVVNGCNTWWTDATSLVKRSVFMDDWIYGISDTELRVSALASMSTVLQTVTLGSQ